jgi:hypothetical protein
VASFDLTAVHAAASDGRVVVGGARYKARLLPYVGEFVRMVEFTEAVLLELRDADFIRTHVYEGVAYDSYGVGISSGLQRYAPRAIREESVRTLCADCGKRTVEPLARAGRRTPFRQFPALEIPAEVAIPTCSNCGAEWIDRKTAGALDAALANQGASVLSAMAREAIEALAGIASQQDLEATLGLSRGYLSKIRHERESPSAPLVALLALLAGSPSLLGEIELLWQTGRLPAPSRTTARKA